MIQTRVDKTRYLSDLASYGLDIGYHVLDEITDGHAPLLLPPDLMKTHDVFIDSTVLRGADGVLLWKVAVHRETDWTRPPNDVIAGLTKKLAKKFPYRG